MLGFDEVKFQQVVAGALSLRERIEKVAAEVTSAGFDELCLLGSGGSLGVMYPFEYWVRNASRLPVRADIAAEFVLRDLPAFGPRSLVVLSSLSGTTAETVAAAEYCRDRGAVTIGLVGEDDTPLARAVDHVLVNFADNDTAGESIHLQLYLLIGSLLARRGDFPEYGRFADELAGAGAMLLAAKQDTESKAEAFALRHRETGYHMLVGAGNLWGHTYNYSMCILEEMQWLRTTRVHGAEFFHGSLELIEKDTSLVLMFGEDETRPLMERVRRFAEKYTDNVTVFDTKDYALEGLSPEFRPLLAPLVLSSVFDRVSHHLADKRGHALTIRRYYRTVEY